MSLNIVLTSCTRLTQHYVEGIAWVLHYYYQGVSYETKACKSIDIFFPERHLPGNGIILSILPPLPRISRISKT